MKYAVKINENFFTIFPEDNISEGFIEISEDIYNNSDMYIWQDGELVVNPNYEAEQAAKRSQEFNKQFFNTSLGYIRRKVTMANGEIKDFLTDLLPSIAMGVQFQKPVTVITYKEPDFTEEITDWTKYQEIKQVTSQFIDECFEQLNNDFVGN